jgi:preprotein translocase subunit SecG
MITFLYVVYVMVCLFLILVVLLQAGRGGMGAAFGGSSQTVFGGSGAGNFLTRLTVISAALFMMLSAALTYVSSSGEKSLEKATERVRMREEARSGGSDDANTERKADDKAATGAASEATSSPENAAELGSEAAEKVLEDEGSAEPGEQPQGAADETAPAQPAKPTPPSGNP